jgi:hypothetical protein
VHQEADTGGVAGISNCWIFVEEAVESVGISGLEKFKAALGMVHGSLLILTRSG